MELRIFDFNDGFLRKKRFLNNEKKVLPVIIHVPKSLGNRLESKGKVSWFEFKPSDDSQFDIKTLLSKVLGDVTVYLQTFLKFS